MNDKITRDEVKLILGITSNDPGALTLSKGKFTIRREYYWRPSKTPEESFVSAIEKLKTAGFDVKDVDTGDKWATFKGGEGVKKNSHYWCSFKLTRVVPVATVAA